MSHNPAEEIGNLLSKVEQISPSKLNHLPDDEKADKEQLYNLIHGALDIFKREIFEMLRNLHVIDAELDNAIKQINQS